MLASDQRPVEILNELIVLNINRLEGFQYALKETDATVLKVLFTRLTETSLICKKQLENEVYKLGGEPCPYIEQKSDVTKVWAEVKEALVCKDHLTILKSCEQEEAVVIKLYENVLVSEEENMTSQHQRLFSRHCEMLSADHSKVRNLLNVLLKTG